MTPAEQVPSPEDGRKARCGCRAAEWRLLVWADGEWIDDKQGEHCDPCPDCGAPMRLVR